MDCPGSPSGQMRIQECSSECSSSSCLGKTRDYCVYSGQFWVFGLGGNRLSVETTAFAVDLLTMFEIFISYAVNYRNAQLALNLDELIPV